MRSFSDSYRDAGVNIEAGYEGVKLMSAHVKRTMIPGVVSDIGGFGGLFAPDFAGMKEPVLVSGTDGVGTDAGIDDEGRNENTAVTVDIDLEEMCDKARNEYNACCDAVGAGVERGRAEGRGFNLLSDGFVVEDHVELNEY